MVVDSAACYSSGHLHEIASNGMTCLSSYVLLLLTTSFYVAHLVLQSILFFTLSHFGQDKYPQRDIMRHGEIKRSHSKLEAKSNWEFRFLNVLLPKGPLFLYLSGLRPRELGPLTSLPSEAGLELRSFDCKSQSLGHGLDFDACSFTEMFLQVFLHMLPWLTSGGTKEFTGFLWNTHTQLEREISPLGCM